MILSRRCGTGDIKARQQGIQKAIIWVSLFVTPENLNLGDYYTDCFIFQKGH